MIVKASGKEKTYVTPLLAMVDGEMARIDETAPFITARGPLALSEAVA
jgi:hypothetical protein